ncbi:MAG: hypothetical protein IPJ69_04465 [Deltaproteobacteria bacterium]|nr:MAG: hypothetical protein IPJ69_04465 [Deltaproteobacteria bacterium]
MGFENSNPLFLAFKRNAVFIAFFMIINSYGIDWMLGEIIPISASIYIYKYFFPNIRQVSNPQHVAVT